ncbi:uncharacterized protein LOC142345335 [Convolutriloba macropyga]|uniref:uncharacterized protein LOC142345335 n=1 Tax=Convolutriloba macropyga TaxID=536237 RepID=UPI003F525C62
MASKPISNTMVTIGTFTSNVLEYAYEVRSRDNPAASESTLSLDTFYHPAIRTEDDEFHLISSDFLYKVPFKIMTNTNWPQKLSVDKQTNFSGTLRITEWSHEKYHVVLKGGMLSVQFVDHRNSTNTFLTPYYNLQKLIQTI